MTFKVLKPFYKLSEKKNYSVGDTIELSDAQALLDSGHVEEVKEVKVKKVKND